jgi:hypothetical protein
MSRTGRPSRWALAFFGLVIVLAALAFGFKFYEFFVNLSEQRGFRFAGAHLLNYLLVAGGFFLLLAACFLGGQFADIEAPKHDLLTSERDHDHADFG